jgi:signal transduction histidine kinase
VLETLVGTGVVGGHVLSPALDGEKGARLALRVLAGERAGPPVPGGTVPIFDWWQLQRWGLDERQLPAGSVLRFRQPSLWEAYRWHVVAVVLIVLAQSALIAGLLVMRHRRRQAERARQQAVEQAQRARDELAHTLRVTTLGGLVAAIAHEISQPLTAIVTNAEATRRIVSHGPTADEATAALADIKADAVRASQVIQRLRALSRKVRGESREIDLERLIDETVSILRADLALKRITLLVAPAKDPLPLVSGDPIQMQQVLLNVLVNASEAIAAVESGPREIAIETTVDQPGFVCVCPSSRASVRASAWGSRSAARSWRRTWGGSGRPASCRAAPRSTSRCPCARRGVSVSRGATASPGRPAPPGGFGGPGRGPPCR